MANLKMRNQAGIDENLPLIFDQEKPGDHVQCLAPSLPARRNHVNRPVLVTINDNKLQPVEPTKHQRVYKVVLTGGPCGGKTTGQSRLRSFFENLGWKVYTVPETATMLFSAGVKFEHMPEDHQYEFQKDVVATLLRIESVFFHLAEMSVSGPPILIICDRGAMDPWAYTKDDATWKKLLSEMGLDQFSLRESRYDQEIIFHMTTAADGAAQYYTHESNQVRMEGIKDAVVQDHKAKIAWLGHPRVDVIENTGCKSFEDKILKLIAAVCTRIGIQTQDRLAFNSKKRKWLIKSLEQSKMPFSENFEVCHHFLRTESSNTQVRIRSRSQNGRATYDITTRQYGGPEPIETRMQLTQREYIKYKSMEDPSRAVIHKERRCFMFGKQYFHIDIYKEPLPPSCKGRLLMILETYTTAPVGDEQSPQLPSFLRIEKEVTDDSEYSMYNIASMSLLNGSREM